MVKKLNTNYQKLRVAIFYDWLNQWGGAEKVFLDILKIYPNADIYTLIYDPKNTSWLPQQNQIRTSFINQLSLTKKNNLLHTPLYSLALEQFDFSDYDIVISTTSTVGHCLLTPPQTLYVCYFHNTNRYLYQTPKQYQFLTPILKKYQQTDFIYAQRPDFLLCNSQTVKDRISSSYHRSAKVIYPGIDNNFFVPSKPQPVEPYFLVVSRLVPHKKIDIAIKACQEVSKKLIIVGEGRDFKRLNKIKDSKSKVIFMGKVSPKKLLYLYQNCSALICPQIEDFGLTPIEAQACGKPVIAFKDGGLTETVIDGKTGIFFEQQTADSLQKTLLEFSPDLFSESECVKHAAEFSVQNFMLNFKQTINQLWQQHQTNIL